MSGLAGFGLRAILGLAALTASAPAFAQQAPESEDLAKKLANPISDLVSIPFQMNWDSGVGPTDQTRFLLNVQPVMPFALTKDVNMIVRIIVPFLSQPALAPGAPADFGMSDVLASVFFSPRESSIIWGAGPALSLPSTSQPMLGTEKWSAGPTAVVLKQQGGWTYGALVNQLWSFAGNTTRSDVSQFYIQPFVAYTTHRVWTMTVSSESTANWEADSGERWTVPVILSVSRLSTFGIFPASYQIGAGVYTVTPTGGPSWKARFAISVLLPRRS